LIIGGRYGGRRRRCHRPVQGRRDGRDSVVVASPRGRHRLSFSRPAPARV